MIFRDYKGGLRESMSTANVYTKEELLKHLNKEYSFMGDNITEIKFEYAGFDPRVKWDSYLVLVKFRSLESFKVVGVSNCNYFNLN